MIIRKEIEDIFNDVKSEWDGDNAFKGLQILSKYTDNLIIGATHDKICSADIDEMIELGITKDDIIELSKLNWMIEDDNFACFV